MKNNTLLGQHWLKNREILEEIADLAAEAGASGSSAKTELCVEIGPGLGTLTSSLLKRFEKVIAVEYDDRLARNLPGSFPGKNLEVINGDFLEVDLGELTRGKKYVLAGNIPYYITSPIIGKILEAEHKPERVVLLMQKEVAERILAKKGNTPLSLLVENQAEVEAGPVVKAAEFEPAPKVDSQVVCFKMRQQPLWKTEGPGGDIEGGHELGAILNMAFEAPRKKILNNLQLYMGRERALAILEEAEVDPNVRPGDLGIAEYQAIWNAMSNSDELIGLMALANML